VAAGYEYPLVTLQLVAAFGRRQLLYRRTDCFLGGVAVEIFGGAIPTGDGAVATGAVDRVTGVLDDGCHLARGAVGARLRQRSLPGHASGDHGNSQENQQPFQVGAGVDAKAEVRRN